jgi:rhodanese-related sulfurtransferase
VILVGGARAMSMNADGGRAAWAPNMHRSRRISEEESVSETRHHQQNPGVLHELDAREVHALLRNRQAVLIDVREPEEFEAERIPGALLFPLSGFDPESLPLDGSKRIIFQCGTGRRSAQAAQRLIRHGSDQASHLAGGLKAWKEAGLPITTFDPSTGRLLHGRL